MLKSSDLIRLPYPAELTRAGIAIASRWLAAEERPGEITTSGAREAVAQAGVALAWRRYLHKECIPFQIQESKPFTEPEQVNAVLGGRCCELATSLITDPEIVKRLFANPERILEMPIQVPPRLQPSDLYNRSDLAVFALAIAQASDDHAALLRKARAGEPLVCSHILPEAWRRPRAEGRPAKLSFRYAGDEPLRLDLYGLNLEQQPQLEQITLQEQGWVSSQAAYRSLSCLQSADIPIARVEVRAAAQRSIYTIMPLQWRNLWVYGHEIILAGYLPFEELWAAWGAVNAGRSKQLSQIELPLANLHPLPLFLNKVSAR